MSARPLLVVAHEASRTGAPRVLVDLLVQIRPTLARPVVVRTLAGGALETELMALADHAAATEPPEVALLNGAAAADVAFTLAEDVHVVAYVHEQGEALAVLPRSCVRALTQRCDRVLCVSSAARDDLIAMGVPPPRLVLLPPAVSGIRPADPGVVDAFLERHDLDPEQPLVIGCGDASWRKGPDLFVDTAVRLRRRRSVQFVWAGRRLRSFARQLDHDTSISGLDAHLRWIGEVDEVATLFSAADLLLMTSREDPQPLAPLEAAGCDLATAGFAIGGLVDLAADGAAAVVDYPDTVALADLADALLDDTARRAGLVARAVQRTERLHDVARLGEHLLAELEPRKGSPW